jgi:hypothetical protein
MNQKVKFLELVLSDLVSQRDTLEMDLNYILNNVSERTNKRKKEFTDILGDIVDTNNKIKTLSEYLSTPDLQEEVIDNNSNNNNS